MMQTVQVNSDKVLITENNLSPMYYLIITYYAVIALLFVRFAIRIISLLLLKNKCSREKMNGYYFAICKKQIAPFSFFKTIFIDEKTMSNAQLNKIIIHETIHIRQLHSIDVMLSELICMLTWFNPASWMIKSALKETHEYLADSGVTEQTSGSSEYLLLLLRNAIGVQPGLANNFNKSLTLKRFYMMKKPRSGRFSMLKALPVIPLLLALFVTFSCGNSANEKKSQNSNVELKNDSVIDKMPEFPGGQDALTKYFIDNVKYPETARKNGITGKVLVNFVVTKTGKIENVEISQKVNDLLDAEALRVISSMPDWIPGENKGEAVDFKMTLPIQFRLN